MEENHKIDNSWEVLTADFVLQFLRHKL